MLQEYKYYTECMRAIIWTSDARIIVKRPKCYPHNLWRYIKLVNLNLDYRRIYASLGLNELRPKKTEKVKTEKDNELPIPGRFSNQIGILDIQSTRGILRFGVIFSKSLIYGGYLRFPKSWGRQNFNWFPIFTEFMV